MRSCPIHEVVNSFGGRLQRVRVVVVAERGEPGMPGGVGVPVHQRVRHDGGQEAVGLLAALVRQGVDVACEDLDVGVRRLDELHRLQRLHVSDQVVVPVGVVCVRHQVGGEEINAEPVEQDAGPAQAFLHKDLAVEAPEAAADVEGGELDLDQGVAAEDGQTRAAQWEEVAGAARVEDAEVGRVGQRGLDQLVVGAVPHFL